MLTTNKLTTIATNSLATGVAALVSLTGSLLVTPSVSAQTICFEGSATILRDDNPIIECGDKTFKNFQLGGSLFDDFVIIGEDEGLWSFNYFFDPEVTSFPGSFTIGYEIDITDPNFFFDAILLGTDAGEESGFLVTKEIFDSQTGELLATLSNDELGGVAITGTSILDLNIQHLRIVDTISVTDNGELFALGNGFSQSTHTPEPSTILGLLAVGGLGMVSQFRKQK
jgi:hypothetical protein